MGTRVETERPTVVSDSGRLSEVDHDRPQRATCTTSMRLRALESADSVCGYD